MTAKSVCTAWMKAVLKTNRYLYELSSINNCCQLKVLNALYGYLRDENKCLITLRYANRITMLEII